MKKKNVKNKAIPTKNYIAVLVMFLITIIAVLGLSKWYSNYKEYQLTVPVISGKLNEITIKDFDNYLTEHENFYLYMCTSSDIVCRNLEKDLPKLLQSKGIKDETIYINLSNVKDDEINSKFGFKSSDCPIFAIYKNGLMYGKTIKNNSNFDISDIEKLLDEYEVGKK